MLGAMLAIVVLVDTGTIPTPATAKAALPVSTPAASPISPGSAFAKRGKGWIVILPLWGPPDHVTGQQTWDDDVPEKQGQGFLVRRYDPKLYDLVDEDTWAWAIVLFIPSAVVLGMGCRIARIPWVDRLSRKRQERKVQAALAMLPKRDGD